MSILDTYKRKENIFNTNLVFKLDHKHIERFFDKPKSHIFSLAETNRSEQVGGKNPQNLQ